MVKSVSLSKSDWIRSIFRGAFKVPEEPEGGMMRKAPSKAYKCYPEKKNCSFRLQRSILSKS